MGDGDAEFADEVQEMLDAIELANHEDLKNNKAEWKTISVYAPPLTALSFQEQNDMDLVDAKGGSHRARDLAEKVGELVEKERIIKSLGNNADLLRWGRRP